MLVRIVEETKPDSNQEDAWLRRIDICRDNAGVLTDAVKSMADTPSIGAFNFVGVTQVEEVNFFSNLAKTKVGERRDKIVANGMKVVTMRAVLEEKWRFLSDQDNSLDDYQKRIADQIETILDKAYDDADRERRTIKERLVGHVQGIARFVKKYGKPIRELLEHLPSVEAQALKSLVEGIEHLQPSIEAGSKIWLGMNSNYHARVAEYRGLLRSEVGGVYVLFGGFRRDTEDFIRNNGFDKAKLDYQAASDALSSWISSSATSAQKSGCSRFRVTVEAA